MAPRAKKSEPKPLTGFAIGHRHGRTKTHVCDVDGFEGFEITVQRLSFADLEALPDLAGTTHEEMWPQIAPYVVGWNAQAENADTGDWEDVPPPAEAGVDVFRLLDPILSAWVVGRVKFGHLGGDDLRKKPTTSESTPEQDVDSTSASGTS